MIELLHYIQFEKIIQDVHNVLVENRYHKTVSKNYYEQSI